MKASTSSSKARRKSGEHRYGPKAEAKISKVMHEWKQGKLRSGGSGKKVTSREQAVAIGISEARREGDKVPAQPKTKSRSVARKRPARRSSHATT